MSLRFRTHFFLHFCLQLVPILSRFFAGWWVLHLILLCQSQPPNLLVQLQTYIHILLKHHTTYIYYTGRYIYIYYWNSILHFYTTYIWYWNTRSFTAKECRISKKSIQFWNLLGQPQLSLSAAAWGHTQVASTACFQLWWAWFLPLFSTKYICIELVPPVLSVLQLVSYHTRINSIYR